MRRSIPKSVRWRITLSNGTEVEVWAPTRLLAKWNIRAEHGIWNPIRSIIRINSKGGTI